jgi:hypothetical protein
MKETSNKYVAYCDILGFSKAVISDFEATKKVYQNLTKTLDSVLDKYKISVEAKIHSDAIMMVSDELPPLVSAIKTICFFTLQQNWLVRGGVAFGKHWEGDEDKNFEIVSEGLVKAVKLEGAVNHPIIAISEEILLDHHHWIPHLEFPYLYGAPFLFYDDFTFVNPFNMFWFKSAIGKIEKMKRESPDHTSKYDWMLGLV